MNKHWEIKNNVTNEVIRFDQDMQWFDEFKWSKVAQASPVYTLGGSVEVQQGVKKAGRPITLSGDWAWSTRGDLLKLRDWSDTPDLDMTLTHYDTSEYKVIFRIHEQALVAQPVMYMTPEADGDPYTTIINLMEI